MSHNDPSIFVKARGNDRPPVKKKQKLPYEEKTPCCPKTICISPKAGSRFEALELRMVVCHELITSDTDRVGDPYKSTDARIAPVHLTLAPLLEQFHNRIV